VAFSSDGRLLASGSYDKTVRLWDPATGMLEQTLKGHLDSIHSVAFSPDGRLLASGSSDKTVRLWDPATGALGQTLKGHLNSVHSVAFSPDGQLLASGSYDKTVRLWDSATGALEHTLEGLSDWVTKLEFSQDGSSLSTNLGSFKIQSRRGKPIVNSHNMKPEISIQHSYWIALNGKQVLWLPPEARPSCLAIKSNTLALGHASGRISFIGFRDAIHVN
jgi:WD40 repeat protein